MEQLGTGRLTARLRRHGLLRLDHGLALGLVWVAVALVADHSPHSHLAVVRVGLLGSGVGRWPVVVFAVLVAVVGLVLRRSQPLAGLFVVAAAVVATPVPLLLLGAALVALYTVGASLGRLDTAIAGLAVVVAFVLQRTVWSLRGSNSLPPVLVGVVASAVLGLYVGVRRVSAVERTGFERQQEALVAERTVAEERVRIARELHDVVAHTLSLIIVQSEVLRTKLKGKDVRAGAASIAELGRDAMGELHRTLELLRGEGEPGERAPQPVLADLEQLSGQSRDGGLDVDLSVEGTARSLPASLELCAYRIVQEALTNVRRHAEAEHAAVRVRYGTDALEVSIEDDGTGTTAEGDSDGHGVRGMRERAAMLGGALSAGRLEDGGYRVSAILPYPEPR
jgi:signal transduction histidine kinase